jgi:hypothetical protein
MAREERIGNDNAIKQKTNIICVTIETQLLQSENTCDARSRLGYALICINAFRPRPNHLKLHRQYCQH